MLVSRLTQLTRLLRAAAKSSGARGGLTLARARIVALLSTAPGMTQVEIAERLHVTAPTVQRHLDGLELAGLLVRARDTQDRRKVVVSLTPKGRGADATGLPGELETALTDGIDPDDLRVVMRVIDRMIQNLQGALRP